MLPPTVCEGCIFPLKVTCLPLVTSSITPVMKWFIFYIFPSYSVWLLCLFSGISEPFLLGKRLSGKSWYFSFPAFILRRFDPHNFSEVLSWQLVFGIPGVQNMPFSKGILSGEYSHTFACMCLLS